jgi:hypothetical protein
MRDIVGWLLMFVACMGARLVPSIVHLEGASHANRKQFLIREQESVLRCNYCWGTSPIIRS